MPCAALSYLGSAYFERHARMAEYRFRKVMGEGLVVLSSIEYGQQIWHRMTLHKAKHCDDCRTLLAVGTECFRPFTNGYNRMHRLCATCVGRLIRKEETCSKR
jgi:hypothetical protein